MNALWLLLLCCQDPAPRVEAEPPRALDVVLLKNGDRLEGRIVAQVDGYVELMLDAGATIGVSMAQVAAVRRGEGARVEPVVAAARPSNEWFVLHDGHGAAVGWLHAAVTNAADGSFTISEEYEFVDGRRRYQITSLCTADASWAPRSCYFRERVSDPLLATAPLSPSDASSQPERVGDERIVEATRVGSGLQVVRLDRTGRRERSLELAPGATFPLLARALARQTGQAVVAATLFDPATEELVVRSFDGARQRRVTLDGKPLQVTEIAESTSTGRNSEWLDASMRTLRRELAGPSLVAVPSSADSVRHAVGGASIRSSVVAEAGGEFGLWVPNPAWQVREDLPAGQVALDCEAHGASIALSRLDYLERDTAIDNAVDAVANWFRLLHPGVRIDSRQGSLVRDRAGVRLLASGRAGPTAMRASIDVIPHRSQFLVLVCQAPAASWDELGPDFDFLLRSIELAPQALAPKLQGPLAEPQPPARPKGGKDSAPLVRIPGDG